MIAILKHDVRKHIGAPLLLLAVIYILVCIGGRQGYSESYELFVLKILSDQYLIIYGVTPVFIWSIFRKLKEDTPLLIVRFRTFTHYFYTKWLAISIYATLFVLLQIIMVLIMGIGLPVGNAYPVNSLVENELFYYFEAVFSTPLLAVVSSSLFMIIGLSFVGVSILTIFHFFNRRVVLITVLLAYLIMVIGLKIPALGSLPFITLNRYIILHHNLVMENGVLWSVTGMIVLTFVQIICIRFARYRKFSLYWDVTSKGLFFYYARALWTVKIILLLCGIIGTLTIFKAMSGMEESMQDYILRFFYGLETGSFNLVAFLEQLIYYGTSLYLLAMFVETWCSDKNMAIVIRIGKKKKWLWAFVSNGLLFHVIYICLTFFSLFICGLFTNKLSMANTIMVSEDIQMSYWAIFLFLKIMELSVLFLAFFLLYIWLKNVTAAYLTVMVMIGLNLIAGVFFSNNPVSLVTISNLQLRDNSMDAPLYKVFTFLMIGFILLIGFIGRSYQRIFN